MQDYYIGKQFNNLKVIEELGIINGKTYWKCECQCENKTVKNIMATYVKNGYIKSCGCLKIQKLKDIQFKNRKYNTYNLYREYGIGYTDDKKEFYFDLEDYNKIKKYYWIIDKDGYVVTQCKEYSKLRMHRLIMDVLDIREIEIDHISRIRHNNRKSNLRYCDDKENARNRSIQSNNTSGTVGVCYNKQNNKWRSYIKLFDKQINLGSYKDINKAIEIRELAENLFFKDFCPRIKSIEDFNTEVIKEFKNILQGKNNRIGSNSQKSVINETIAKDIKILINDGFSNKEISLRTKVSISIIKNIRYNKTWKHVKIL